MNTEDFNKETENIKKYQREVTELKNTPGGSKQTRQSRKKDQ